MDPYPNKGSICQWWFCIGANCGYAGRNFLLGSIGKKLDIKQGCNFSDQGGYIFNEARAECPHDYNRSQGIFFSFTIKSKSEKKF